MEQHRLCYSSWMKGLGQQHWFRWRFCCINQQHPSKWRYKPLGLEPGEHATWQRPWKIGKANSAWIALLSQWGVGLEYDLEVTLWVTATWLPMVKVHFTHMEGATTLLKGISVSVLWRMLTSLVPLLVEEYSEKAMPREVWYKRPGQILSPATVLSQDKSLAWVLLDGQDLPLMIPITTLSYPLSLVATNTMNNSNHSLLSMYQATSQLCNWTALEFNYNHWPQLDFNRKLEFFWPTVKPYLASCEDFSFGSSEKPRQGWGILYGMMWVGFLKRK